MLRLLTESLRASAATSLSQLPENQEREFGTCYRSKFKASIFPAYYHPEPKKLFFRCPNPRFLNFFFFSLHPFLPPNLYSKFPRNTIETLKQPYIPMSSRSQIFAPTLYQIKRAWHLLTVLLQWGHPASPVELASRSEFHSVFLSPDIVEFLCGIPGSPISPTGDRLLVAFKVAVAALRQYLDLTRGSFVPRLLFRASEDRRGWSSIKLVYRTKRKVRPLEAGLMGPGAKRRLLWGIDGGKSGCCCQDFVFLLLG